jgi:hypothetical protein
VIRAEIMVVEKDATAVTMALLLLRVTMAMSLSGRISCRVEARFKSFISLSRHVCVTA